jgi:hypothetical protein
VELKLGERVIKELPSNLVPDPDNGATLSSWIALRYSFTNVSSFCEIRTAKNDDHIGSHRVPTTINWKV